MTEMDPDLGIELSFQIISKNERDGYLFIYSFIQRTCMSGSESTELLLVKV